MVKTPGAFPAEENKEGEEAQTVTECQTDHCIKNHRANSEKHPPPVCALQDESPQFSCAMQ